MKRMSILTQVALASKLNTSLESAKKYLRDAFIKDNLKDISNVIKHLEDAKHAAEELWKNTDADIWKEKLDEINDYLSTLKETNVKLAIHTIKSAEDYGTAVDALTVVFKNRKDAENFVALAMIVDGFIKAGKKSKK